MKRDAEDALRAYYQALASEPMPAIEVRIGRRVSGPALPLAAGVCAAALLPMLSPSSEVEAQPIMGMAALQGEDQPEAQSALEPETKSWVV